MCTGTEKKPSQYSTTTTSLLTSHRNASSFNRNPSTFAARSTPESQFFASHRARSPESCDSGGSLLPTQGIVRVQYTEYCLPTRQVYIRYWLAAQASSPTGQANIQRRVCGAPRLLPASHLWRGEARSTRSLGSDLCVGRSGAARVSGPASRTRRSWRRACCTLLGWRVFLVMSIRLSCTVRSWSFCVFVCFVCVCVCVSRTFFHEACVDKQTDKRTSSKKKKKRSIRITDEK